MRFASGEFLWGTALALLLAAILVGQGIQLTRARRRFGSDAQIVALLSAKSGIRRGISAVLVCLAVALAFVAAAQPQYGKGTRVLPATNLDVVLVLDYSKSMYARDVTPSRVDRAKVEVENLIRQLGGARFGAVAFAGESISFPLTSDGAAIAQFFRGLVPNDMAVGGTAIARAMASAQNLLERDPLSKNHERVLVLITDGEDLEGDPVQVAREAASSGIRVEVVQIGGQTPEPIPEIDERGNMVGMRRDAEGRIMTTQLSPEGEAQLLEVAKEGRGQLVRASAGSTGIEELTKRLRQLMSEELSERVETVYADVFQYPLAAAIVLLMCEVWVGTAPKRRVIPEAARGTRPRKRRRMTERAAILCVFSCLGCEQAHPFVDEAFLRESPEVNAAIAALEAGDGKKAADILGAYLETGPCEDGVLGVGDRARERRDASFDLALTFSQLAQPKAPSEHGDATAPPAPAGGAVVPPGGPAVPPPPLGASDAAPPNDETQSKIGCAIRLLGPIVQGTEASAELRARSHYLAGNLEMLRTDYDAAIDSFDRALRLSPGLPEGLGDPLGAQIARNRALALRLLKEQKEQQKAQEEEKEKEPQDSGDQEQDQGSKQDPKDEEEGEKDQNPDSEGDEQKKEGPQNQEANQPPPPDQDDPSKDEQKDGEQSDEPSNEAEENEQPGQASTSTPPPPQGPQKSTSRDERMLDLLEQAPTLQQHDAAQRKAQGVLGRPTMEDK